MKLDLVQEIINKYLFDELYKYNLTKYDINDSYPTIRYIHINLEDVIGDWVIIAYQPNSISFYNYDNFYEAHIYDEILYNDPEIFKKITGLIKRMKEEPEFFKC